jgi:hypothetical protein
VSNDRTHTDKNAKVRAIVDDAIAELLMIGMESRSEAAALMAIQAMIRIDDEPVMESVAEFAASLIVHDE